MKGKKEREVERERRNKCKYVSQKGTAKSYRKEEKALWVTHPNLHVMIRLCPINNVFPGIYILHDAYGGR